MNPSQPATKKGFLCWIGIHINYTKYYHGFGNWEFTCKKCGTKKTIYIRTPRNQRSFFSCMNEDLQRAFNKKILKEWEQNQQVPSIQEQIEQRKLFIPKP